jgi:hypothetical protein
MRRYPGAPRPGRLRPMAPPPRSVTAGRHESEEIHMSRKRRYALLVALAALMALAPTSASATTKSPTARQRATAQCKAERKRLGAHPFHEKYGVHNEAGALAKCVTRRLRRGPTR